ncbi:MAG TPA: MarC family protein, partial [Thermoanaerobaculia bacterium]
MPLTRVITLSFIALITMVNPLAVVPSFVALTEDASRKIRASVAFVASIACIVVLTTFLLAGNYVFQFFGITVPAFQIMGGIIFLANALRTLIVDDRRALNVGGEKRMEDVDVRRAELDPASIAVVPLAVPMLSGPGAITSVMVLVNLYPSLEQKFAVVVAIASVGVVSYIVLLGAIGIQFIINGVKPVLVEIM